MPFHLMIICLVFSLGIDTVEPALLHTIVVHRHGARGPLLEEVDYQLTGPPPYGELSTNGAEMLRGLGLWLAAELKAGNQTVNASTTRIVSAPTARCVQSAEALFSGLREGMGANGPLLQNCPIIRTVERSTDLWFDTWGGMPGLRLRHHVQEPLKYAWMNELILKHFTNATLHALGQELGLGAECPNVPFNCIGDAQDFAAFAQAENRLHLYPLTMSLQPKLNWVMYIGDNYTYNGPVLGTGGFGAMMGRQGYPLAKEIARTLKNPLTPNDASPLLSIFSGHDVTLMPLAKALGNDTILLPPFGAALVFQLWGRGSGRYVTAKYGIPNPVPNLQTPNSLFNYTFSDFVLQCNDSHSNSTGCGLDQFTAFIDQGRPAQALLSNYRNPYCYALPQDLEALNCTPAMTSSSDSVCSSFRQLCALSAASACGDGYVGSDLQCHFLEGGSNATQDDWSMILSSLCVGMLLGLWLTIFLLNKLR
jgi:hypothetical protein